MTLQSSGQISLSQIRTEMNTSDGSLRNLSSSAGKSTPDSMSEFYGFSNYYKSNLMAYTDPYITYNYYPNITSATIYSTYNGGTRSSYFTLQYSDNNSTWYNAGGSIMSNNGSCGEITVTANSGQYGSHRFWRYVEGGAVQNHHPRTARITLGDDQGRSWTIARYTYDNCSDVGNYQPGTVSFDFLYAIPDLTSVSKGSSCNFINGIYYTGNSLIMPGGGAQYGGYGNLGPFPMYGTIQFWFYANVVENYDNYFSTHQNQGNKGIRFEMYTGGTSNVVVANDSNTYTDFSLGSGFSANTWYNIAVTWNRSTNAFKAYKNNSLVVNSSTSNWASELNDVAIGVGYDNGGNRNLNGKFGPLLMYSAELTANQIQQNWITHKARYGY